MHLKMMLLDNFVHADLHPGNILVRKKAGKLSLVILDVGLIFTTTNTDWEHFKDLFRAIVEKNGKYGAKLMVRFAKSHEISPEEEEKFVEEMDKIFSSVRDLKI